MARTNVRHTLRRQLMLRHHVLTLDILYGKLYGLVIRNPASQSHGHYDSVLSFTLTFLYYVQATLFLGNINTGTGPSRLGESQMRRQNMVVCSAGLGPLWQGPKVIMWVNYKSILS
jgi:methyl coenzyme M reductase subunit D